MDERLFHPFGATERFGVSQNIDHCHPKTRARQTRLFRISVTNAQLTITGLPALNRGRMIAMPDPPYLMNSTIEVSRSFRSALEAAGRTRIPSRQTWRPCNTRDVLADKVQRAIGQYDDVFPCSSRSVDRRNRFQPGRVAGRQRETPESAGDTPLDSLPPVQWFYSPVAHRGQRYQQGWLLLLVGPARTAR